jgi:hypothetical protein
LIAAVVALFGLQAPLCALACLELPAASPIAAHGAEPPCHEQSSEPSRSDAPAHADCGCERAQDALLTGGGFEASSGAAPFGPVASRACLRLPDAARLVALPVPKATDLPPPDILLLESKLLI